jgi:adenylate cyclase
MFVSEDPLVAVVAALDIADACTRDPDLPDVRAGLAHGPAFTMGGDYFGPAVNLASRLVATAGAGSVVVSESLRDAVGDTDRLAWGLPRARRLKGLGRVVLWSVRRSEDGKASWLERFAGAIR